jgi:hypothetical protein
MLPRGGVRVSEGGMHPKPQDDSISEGNTSEDHWAHRTVQTSEAAFSAGEPDKARTIILAQGKSRTHVNT